MGRKGRKIDKGFIKSFNKVRESCVGVRLTKEDLIYIFKDNMSYPIERDFSYLVKYKIFKKFGNPARGFTYEITSKPVYIGLFKNMKKEISNDRHSLYEKNKDPKKYKVLEDGSLKTINPKYNNDFIIKCKSFINGLNDFELFLLGLTKIKK
jgi:hypothetical protein